MEAGQRVQPSSVGSQLLPVRVLGAALLAVMGVIDLLVYFGFSLPPSYPGILFILNAIAALALSVGLLLGMQVAWHLAALLAAVTIVLFVVVRTVGLPGFYLQNWVVLLGPLPLGPLSLLVEAGFVALYVTRGRRAADKS